MSELAMTEKTTDKWKHRFLMLAKHVSSWSKDPSTKCGAVIADGRRIVSMGFNGFAQGVGDLALRLNNRDLKYQLVMHAEENAIFFARRPVSGCAIYVWPFPSCPTCMSRLGQVGITHVYYPEPWQVGEGFRERWQERVNLSMIVAEEIGIVVKGLDT